jgi:hypothetical protein
MLDPVSIGLAISTASKAFEMIQRALPWVVNLKPCTGI